MSGSSRVSATTTASAISVPTRVVAGAGFSTLNRIEGVSGTPSAGFSGNWRSGYNDAFSQNSYDPEQGRTSFQAQFTPLVASRASAFPASENYSDNFASTPLFSSDLSRAFGIYTFNMNLFAGNYAAQGSIINRYS
jgi:hypothetical protein